MTRIKEQNRIIWVIRGRFSAKRYVDIFMTESLQGVQPSLPKART